MRGASFRIDFVHFLRQRPLATLCVCYLLGAAAFVVGTRGQQGWMICTGLLALLLFAQSEAWKSDWRTDFGRRAGVLLPAAGFAVGFFVSAQRTVLPPTDVSHYTSAHFSTVRGVLLSEPRSLPFGMMAQMECQQMEQGANEIAVTGKAELFVSQNSGAGRDSSTLQWPRTSHPVEVRGLLQPIVEGSSPAADSLRRHGIYCTLRVGKGGRMKPLPPDSLSIPGTLRNWCEGAMQWTLDGLSPWLQPPERDALAGMLFHRQENMTPGTLDDLQKTGTVHVIATAGLHVGIFMGCCLFILRPLLPRRTAAALTMLLLAGYCVACGGWPAVFRATVVAELYLLARLLGRLPDPLTCLSLTAAGMIYLEPNTLLDPGFQFTFATVGVILLLTPAFQQHREPEGRGVQKRAVQHLKALAALSVAAQVGSWPLTLYYFNIVSYVGVFANLLIVPLLMLIIPLAVLTAVCGHLLPAFALVPGAVLQASLHLQLWLAHQLALQPWCWKYSDGINGSAVVLYYALLAVGVGWLRAKHSP